MKPQFEAGRQEASRNKGVIADPEVWHRVLLEVTGTLSGRGTAIMGLMTSPLRGADGNVEFLLHGRTATAQPLELPIVSLVDAVVAQAGGHT